MLIVMIIIVAVVSMERVTITLKILRMIVALRHVILTVPLRINHIVKISKAVVRTILIMLLILLLLLVISVKKNQQNASVTQIVITNLCQKVMCIE